MAYRDKRWADGVRISELETRLCERERELMCLSWELAHLRSELHRGARIPVPGEAIAPPEPVRVPVHWANSSLGVTIYFSLAALLAAAASLVLTAAHRSVLVGLAAVSVAIALVGLGAVRRSRRAWSQRYLELRADGIEQGRVGGCKILSWLNVEDLTLEPRGPLPAKLVVRTTRGSEALVDDWMLSFEELSRLVREWTRYAATRRSTMAQAAFLPQSSPDRPPYHPN